MSMHAHGQGFCNARRGAVSCRLTVLDASHSSLEGLPEGIGGCTSLVELLCSNNSISRVPVSLSRLQTLKTLDLRANRYAHCLGWQH